MITLLVFSAVYANNNVDEQKNEGRLPKILQLTSVGSSIANLLLYFYHAYWGDQKAQESHNMWQRRREIASELRTEDKINVGQTSELAVANQINPLTRQSQQILRYACHHDLLAIRHLVFARLSLTLFTILFLKKSVIKGPLFKITNSLLLFAAACASSAESIQFCNSFHRAIGWQQYIKPLRIIAATAFALQCYAWLISALKKPNHQDLQSASTRAQSA